MVLSPRLAFAATALLLLVAAPSAGADTATPTTSETVTKTRLERYLQDARAPVPTASNEHLALLAKAAADECAGDVGDSYMAKTGDCPAGRKPKVNQAYLWGLARTGDDLWIGTAPNTLCMAIGQAGQILGNLDPIDNSAFRCEFDESGFLSAWNAPGSPLAGGANPLLPMHGDWRPPGMYRYDTKTGRLHDLSADLPDDARNLLKGTLGLRSAGAIGRTVFLAGPQRDQGGWQAQAINVFAFDAVTKKFVDATAITKYNDIRRWIVAGGKLYTAVGKPDGTGALLRWDGDPDAPGTADNPSPKLFDLTEVGLLDAQGADLAEHKGRIYVTTWILSSLTQPGPGGAVTAGVYRSEPLDEMNGPPTQMTKIWSVEDYEPDPLIATTYLGGGIESFDGKLVWGTMHAPLIGSLQALFPYLQGADVPQILTAVLGSWRGTALFSADRPEADADRGIRLLYGETRLPVFNPSTRTWSLQPNNAGQTPKFGHTGFNNPFNTYSWWMTTTGRELYVGTMDWSYLVERGVETLVEAITGTQLPDGALDLPVPTYGADLMRFRSLDHPAVAVSRSGVGNHTNYGVRTMVTGPKRLYVGTANPMNMHPQGGWELRSLPVDYEPEEPGEQPSEQPSPQPGDRPAGQAQPPVSAASTQASAASQSGVAQCVSQRRFTMHLGFRLKVATARGMRNVKTIRATVNGKRVKARRDARKGIMIPVDLRGKPKGRATVRVQLTLRKPIRVQRRDGRTARTRTVVRTYRFVTC